ncbi:MAG: hypothetical protein K5868_05305 [Lachnospiraceae bacterium]|nr:hypothetical protein [Lachnospiraceae bacterium]
MKNIVIIGAGELGKEVVWLIEDINKTNPEYLILGFLDDLNSVDTLIDGYRVLGKVDEIENLYARNPFYAVVAIQDGTSRRRIVEEHKGYTSWETIVHPTAVLPKDTLLGDGSIVFPHVTFSIHNRLGKHGLYYLNSTVCNDCSFGDYVSIMTGVTVSEHVRIGNESYLSAGCTIYPHISIGDRCKVAVHTTVMQDLESDSK